MNPTPPPSAVHLTLGALVVPTRLPAELPEESVEIFTGTLGRVLRIDDLQLSGAGPVRLVGLNVLDDGEQAPDWCHHTIYFEPELLRLPTLEEIEAALLNGFHDLAVDSIQKVGATLRIVGKAWVGQLDGPLELRESRLPLSLAFGGLEDFTLSGDSIDGEVLDVRDIKDDWGELTVGQPATLFVSRYNALVSFRFHTVAATVPPV